MKNPVRYLSRAAVVAGALTISSASFAQSPGVTDTEITIGLFAGLSGPFAVNGVDALNAARAWYEETNSKGGIHGRKIKVMIEDDKCTTTEINNVARKLANQVFILNGGSCSGATVSLQEFVTREKLPHVYLNAAGDAGTLPPTRYQFGSFPATGRVIAGSLVWFAFEQFKVKKIAVILSDDDLGKASGESITREAKKRNIEIVVNEALPNSATDVTAAALKIRSAAPDAVISVTYPSPTLLLVKKLHEFGMKAPIVQGVQGVPNAEVFAKNVGDDAAIANFYYSGPLVDLPESPKMKIWFDLFAKYNPDRKNPAIYMPYGFPSAMAITRAIEKAGRDLTREKFVDAMETVEFDSGIMVGPIKFAKDRRDAMRGQVIMKFDGKTNKVMPGVFEWDGIF